MSSPLVPVGVLMGVFSPLRAFHEPRVVDGVFVQYGKRLLHHRTHSWSRCSGAVLYHQSARDSFIIMDDYRIPKIRTPVEYIQKSILPGPDVCNGPAYYTLSRAGYVYSPRRAYNTYDPAGNRYNKHPQRQNKLSRTVLRRFRRKHAKLRGENERKSEKVVRKNSYTTRHDTRRGRDEWRFQKKCIICRKPFTEVDHSPTKHRCRSCEIIKPCLVSLQRLQLNDVKVPKDPTPALKEITGSTSEVSDSEAAYILLGFINSLNHNEPEDPTREYSTKSQYDADRQPELRTGESIARSTAETRPITSPQYQPGLPTRYQPGLPTRYQPGLPTQYQPGLLTTAESLKQTETIRPTYEQGYFSYPRSQPGRLMENNIARPTDSVGYFTINFYNSCTV